MTIDEEILIELKKINQQLSYRKNSFLDGLFHSFGNFVGYILIIFFVGYIAARLNLPKLFTQSFENMLSQINWSKIVPQPQN